MPANEINRLGRSDTMIRRIAKLGLAAFAATAPAIIMTGPVAAHDMMVAVEHAEIVRLPGEASAVVVGNPLIADAMVHDGRTLIITGRLQGRTNVIALDRVGRVIYSREIVVSSPLEGQVAVFRGTDRQTLSCGTICEEIPRAGDETVRTDSLSDQQRDRLTNAEMALGDAPEGD
jgi:Flp pilus assembly secretin CpaC